VTLLLRKNFFLSAVIFVLLCASLIITVKADVVTWHQTYGGEWNDSVSSVVETPDGGFVLAGTFGSADFWLIKVDAFGDVVWDNTCGGPEYTDVESLVATSDGGYALAGSITTSMPDALLVKTDEFGNMEWNQTYGGEKVDYASSLLQTSDGGYIFAGTTESYADQPPDAIPLPYGTTDAWLVKTDAYGNMEWNRTYGDIGDEAANSLVATADGGYAFAGFISSKYDGPALLVKTDSLGNMEWNQTFGGGIFNSLVVTSDGGYAIAGIMNNDFWLVKTDSSGNMEWNQTYGTETLEKAYSLVAASDGGYVVAGVTYSTCIQHSPNFIEYKNADFWLVKTDSSGNMEWNQTYGGTESDGACSLIAASDGGYVVAGTTRSFGAGGVDILLIKSDEYGVAPEAAWVVLPFLLAGTLAVFISRKKLFPKR